MRPRAINCKENQRNYNRALRIQNNITSRQKGYHWSDKKDYCNGILVDQLFV